MTSLTLEKFNPTALASIYEVNKSEKIWLTNSQFKPKASIGASEKDTKLEEIHLSYDFDIHSNTIMPQVKAKDNQRLVYAICSPSGAGKSIFAASLAKLWLKFAPKGSMIILIKPDQDCAYSSIPEDQILYFTPEELYTMHREHEAKDQKLYDKFKAPDDVRRLFIFDDCELIHNKHLKKFMTEWQIALLELGRKNRFDTFMILHSLASSNTPALLRSVCIEATHIWFSKMGLNAANNAYALEKKFFVKKKILKKIEELDSRYFTISRALPQAIVSEYNVFLF
jgi:hypothetical protein